ncbi:MAG: CAP domain-containing protein [Arenibacterium sp.]
MSYASDLERGMLELINAERAAEGLGSLTLEFRLNDAAEDHSTWMLDTDTFSHTGVNGSNPGDRMRDADFVFSGSWTWGENVAWQSSRGAAGYEDDVENLHEALMNSPGHRANILNPNFELIGIGIEVGNYSGWNAVMVTQNFARTSADVQLDTGIEPASPIANTPPELTVDDVTLGKVKGARRTKLEELVNVSDADGDEIVWYELRDTKGRDNFIFKGQGKIDADKPFRVDADDLDMIRVRINKRNGETELEVRASDGEDKSDWATFTVTTLSAEDWQALG